MDYKGYTTLTLDTEEMNHFYNTKASQLKLKENEYVVLKNTDGEVVDRLVFQEGELKRIKYPIIESSFLGNIKPRNTEQFLAFHMLQDKHSQIKLLTGKFGTGKSFSMIAQAINFLERGVFNKIVYIRNNINVSDCLELGALPGTVQDKLLPYMMPLADHLGSREILEDYLLAGAIEPIHLGFLRGRDLRDTLIYCTEAQNLSVAHMQLLIGRVAEGSELWLDGDIKQTDRKVFEKSSGIGAVIEKLSGNKHFAYVHLTKNERSEVAALADLLDQ